MSKRHNPRDVIFIMSQVVCGHAEALCALHAKIERSQNTILSVIKGFLGFHVPFDELASETADMDGSWKRIIINLSSTERHLDSEISDTARHYVQLVRQYAEANAAAASLLAERQQVFAIASRSAKRSTLTYAATKEMTRRYGESLGECQRLLEELAALKFDFRSPQA